MNKSEMLKSINDSLMKVKFYYDTLSIVEQADPTSKIRENVITELKASVEVLTNQINEYETIQ